MNLLLRLMFFEAVFAVPIFFFPVIYAPHGSSAVISQNAKAIVLILLSIPLISVFLNNIGKMKLFVYLLFSVVVYRIIVSVNLSMTTLSEFAAFLIFFYLILYGDEKFFLSKLRDLLISAALLTSFYNIMQYYSIDFMGIFSGKMVSTFGNPNFFSQFAAAVFFIAIVSKSKKISVWRISSAAIILFAVFLSGSRAALLSIAIVSIFILLKMRSKKYLIISLLVLTSIFIFGKGTLSTIWQQDIRSSFRYNQTRVVLNEIRYNPGKLLFGFGSDSFEREFAKNVDKDLWYASGKVRIQNIHNEFLAILFENGIVIAALFFTLLVFLLKSRSVYVYSLLSFLITAFFSFPLHIPSTLLLFFIIIGFIYKNRTRVSAEIQLKPGLKIVSLVIVLGVIIYGGVKYESDVNYRLATFINENKPVKSVIGASIPLKYYLKVHANPLSQYETAFLFANEGKYNSANMYIKQALKKLPYDYMILAEQGFIFYKQKRNNRAQYYYRRALKYNRYYGTGWQNIYIFLLKQKKLLNAYRAARQAFFFTHSPIFLKDMGDAEYALGRYTAALKYHKIALMTLKNAEIYNNTGTDLVKLGELRKSLRYFDDALAREPTFQIARKNRNAVEKYLENNK